MEIKMKKQTNKQTTKNYLSQLRYLTIGLFEF